MASTLDLANYSVSESFSKILKINNLQTTGVEFKGEYVSSDDGAFQLGLIYMPNKCKQAGKPTDYVFISLRAFKCCPKFWVHLDVSLLDVEGEKTMTQGFSKKLSELQKDDIFYRFISRESLLASPSLYLYNGNLKQLKVLFEVSLLKLGTRAPLTSLSKDCASLLASGSFSDVTLVVGNMDFPLHKAILSERSPVFARMFKESKESRFVLEETDELVFKQLLNFIYTGRVWNIRENPAELLIVAEKYKMNVLRDICGQYLSTTVRMDNLLSLLQLAYQHSALQLQSKCLDFFERHSKHLKMTENFKQLIAVKSDVNQELLGLLLQTVMATEYPVKKMKLFQEP